jgi:hypothetical protein
VDVKWPALLSFKGDPELEFIQDEEAWRLSLTDFAGHFVEGDQLVDSDGNAYPLSMAGEIQPTINSCSLEQIIQLIQAHAFAENNVCVAKISAPDIHSAVALLKYS